jgi:hypothetical protein
MGNKTSRVLVVALVAVATITAGCGISITRNSYYIAPEKQETTTSFHEAKSANYMLDSLTNGRNDFTRPD